MTYGYIRVSTDMQDTENQKLGIVEKAKQLGVTIDEWISDDGVSGAKEPEKRLLGKLLKKVKENDIIITSEISRLGRQLFMIFRILEGLLEKGVKLYSVKDGYNLDNSITSKVLAFAFGMASEIERDMIRKRTIEALETRKRNGVVLGRPAGNIQRTNLPHLIEKKPLIEKLLKEGVSLTKIAKKVKCHRLTLSRFIQLEGIEYQSRWNTTPMFTEVQREIAQKRSIPLLERKQEIIAMVEQGFSIRRMTQEVKSWGISISESGFRNFILRENLHREWVFSSTKLRLEKNKNAENFNPEKLNEILKKYEERQIKNQSVSATA